MDENILKVVENKCTYRKKKKVYLDGPQLFCNESQLVATNIVDLFQRWSAISFVVEGEHRLQVGIGCGKISF